MAQLPSLTPTSPPCVRPPLSVSSPRRGEVSRLPWLPDGGAPCGQSVAFTLPPSGSAVTVAERQWRETSLDRVLRSAVRVPRKLDASGTPRYLSGARVARGYTMPLKRADKCSPVSASRPARSAPASLAAPLVQIVEAVSGITVDLEWPMRVPVRSWLVLADGHGRARSLVEQAGGGVVAEGDAMALLPVGESRLHVVAAEANFQRAARGASLVALRHATLILGLLGQSEADSGSRCQAVSVEEAVARGKRYEQIVASREAVVAQRGASSAQMPDEIEEADVTPELPALAGPLCRQSMLQRGFEALQEFITFSNRRFGNPVRTWFQLDPQENMLIGKGQFVRMCEEVCFRGGILALWKYLDSDHTGNITLLELDPKSAIILAELKLLIRAKFDDSSVTFFKCLDHNRSKRVSKADFVARVRNMGFEGPVQRSFDLLDRRGLGFVIVADMVFLDRWAPPPYLFCRPDVEGRRRLKSALLEVHASPLRAWRKVMDLSGTWRTSWDGFRAACGRFLRSVPELASEIPKNEAEMASVWRAFDDDCSGVISLQEFDEAAFANVAEFKRWADRVHGGAVKALSKLDHSNSKLSETELERARLGEDGFKGDTRLLFEGLDVNDAWFLTESDFKCFDEWDLAWEEWERAAKQRG